MLFTLPGGAQLIGDRYKGPEGLHLSGPLDPRASDGSDRLQCQTSGLGGSSPADLGSSLALGKSPININALNSYLDLYPNKQDANLLKNGFTNGFRLGFTGDLICTEIRNLKSARLNPAILRDKIDKEVALGRFAGPFKEPPIKNLKVSPVGLVPKANGDYRLITHLSHPAGSSVNDGISEELSSVQYTSFDTVADMIFRLGNGSLMAKRDIKSAFRLLPIAPADFCLLGLKDEDGNLYIDKFLPMGCKISCSLFEKFATFLHWLVQYISGQNTMDHYLDDFIFGGARGTIECHTLLDTFTSVCSQLAVPIAHEKSIEPCTRLIFLGLEMDSIFMLVQIPLHRIEELRDIITNILSRKKVSLREFQSIVGKLSFFSRAVRSSRAFLRRFYDVMVNITRAHHKLRITEAIKKDLCMWSSFLENYNGVSYIPPEIWSDSDILQLFTDSAGSPGLGCGCFFHGDWAFFQWPESWCKKEVLKDITFLEMVPVLLAIMLWGDRLKNSRVLLRIDNEALVVIINKQTTRSKRLMELVRQFVLLAMEFGIIFKAKHITTHCNKIADSVSRKQWDRFRAVAPDANRDPQIIPERFLMMIYSLNLRDC